MTVKYGSRSSVCVTVTGKMRSDEENSHFSFFSAFLNCINVKNKNPKYVFFKIFNPKENMNSNKTTIF